MRAIQKPTGYGTPPIHHNTMLTLAPQGTSWDGIPIHIRAFGHYVSLQRILNHTIHIIPDSIIHTIQIQSYHIISINPDSIIKLQAIHIEAQFKQISSHLKPEGGAGRI